MQSEMMIFGFIANMTIEIIPDAITPEIIPLIIDSKLTPGC